MVIKFCVSAGKLSAEPMKSIRTSETINPCSVSAVYKWQERFRNRRKLTKGDSRDGPLCVMKMTMKDITF